MSDNWIIYVPKDPDWTPSDRSKVAAAEGVLARAYPDAEDIADELTEGVQFVDCGTNMDGVGCPYCGTDLSEAWSEMMGAAFDEDAGCFASLQTNTPCCKRHVSLNDLVYERPSAFGRFTLSVFRPDKAIDDTVLSALQAALGTDLTTILRHL